MLDEGPQSIRPSAASNTLCIVFGGGGVSMVGRHVVSERCIDPFLRHCEGGGRVEVIGQC